MLFQGYFLLFFFFNLFLFLFFLSFFKKNKELTLSSEVTYKPLAARTNTLEFTYFSNSDLIIVRQWLHILHIICYKHPFILTPINTYSVVTKQGHSVFLSNTQKSIFCSSEIEANNLFEIKSSVEDLSFFTEEGRYSPELIQCSNLFHYQDVYIFLPSIFNKNIPLFSINILFNSLSSDLFFIFLLEKKQNKSLIFLRKFIYSNPFFFLNISFVKFFYKQLFFLITFFF